MKSKILYEDNDILVIYKPAGLATQTARTGQMDAVNELKNYLKNPYLGVIHRLDQPVEGLLVFAKKKEAAGRLSAQLGSGALNKRYYAVVCGQPQPQEGVLSDYLKKDSATQSAAVFSDPFPEAQKAVLRYRVAGCLPAQEPAALLDIRIETGRFHQIRAQLSHAGWPVLGDSRYGNEESTALSRRLNVKNVALCAYALAFRHPVTGKNMNYQIKPEGEIFSRFLTT